MKPTLVAMTLVSALVACSNSSDTGDSANEQVDSGARDPGPLLSDRDGGIDSGLAMSAEDAAVAVKVTNPGAACAKAQVDCMGAAATCESLATSGDRFPGGYCSASCLFNEECGVTGDCPIGEIIRTVGASAVKGITAGICYEKCTPGATSGCRPKYECATLAEALGVTGPNSNVPALRRPICVPTRVRGDGGVGDAGHPHATDAGGIDAGA